MVPTWAGPGLFTHGVPLGIFQHWKVDNILTLSLHNLKKLAFCEP